MAYDAYDAGRKGEVFLGSTYAEFQAYEMGRNTAAGGISMPAGGALIMAQLYAIAAACFCPVAGTLGLGTFLWLRNFFGTAEPPYSPLVSVPTLLGLSALGLYVGYRLEQRLAFITLYRRLRRILRLVLALVVITYFAITWRGNPYVPSSGVTLDWILSQLSPFQMLLIVTGVVVTHLLSRRSDERYEVWTIAARRARERNAAGATVDIGVVAEEVRSERAYDRQNLRQRRLRSGTYVGAIAAVILAITGVPAGGVIVGFLAFGALGALLARFIPQNLIGMRWLSRIIG